MFCPSCGSEDRQANQFCRSCGADLRVVQIAVSRPDQITASAASARDEIGRAIAAKIRETQNATELTTVAAAVLPEVEKFLESPEEKRMRRMRVGLLLSSIGAGVAIGVPIAAVMMGERDMLFLAALGVVAFFLGIGFMLNGYFLTVPKRSLPDTDDSARTDHSPPFPAPSTEELRLPQAPAEALFPSVTEHTTQHLEDKKDAVR